MTYHDGFDRTVSEWLDEQAGRGAPAYLDEVLTRTTRTRQRPAWSSLERWLPVDIAAYRSVLNRPASMRGFALLIVLALLIAAIIAVAVGSRRALPAPYGLAQNGAVITSADGDIFAVDPKTGRSSPLIADAKLDIAPAFSRDGTKFLFLRGIDQDTGMSIVVANADGSGERQITPVVLGLEWFDWSPNGAQIAFLSRPEGDGTAGVINVVNVDGTGLRPLEIGMSAFYPSWLPPDGNEIVFRSEQLRAGDAPPGIFAVHPDGTGLRPISTRRAVAVDDFEQVSVSPDGMLVGYSGLAPVEGYDVHVLDMESGTDRILPKPIGVVGQRGPVFSPDNRSVVYLRVTEGTEGNRFQIVVAPADGSGTGTALGPLGSRGSNGPSINNYVFTPDGTAIIAGYDDENLARVLPIDGSAGSVLSRGDLAFITYQRLAP